MFRFQLSVIPLFGQPLGRGDCLLSLLSQPICAYCHLSASKSVVGEASLALSLECLDLVDQMEHNLDRSHAQAEILSEAANTPQAGDISVIEQDDATFTVTGSDQAEPDETAHTRWRETRHPRRGVEFKLAVAAWRARLSSH
jgi:hypothetical protein